MPTRHTALTYVDPTTAPNFPAVMNARLDEIDAAVLGAQRAAVDEVAGLAAQAEVDAKNYAAAEDAATLTDARAYTDAAFAAAGPGGAGDEAVDAAIDRALLAGRIPGPNTVAARLATSGSADRAAALAASTIAHTDAENIAESWANLTGWTVSGPLAVTDGRAHTTSTTGTDSTGRRYIGLTAGQSLMVAGTFDVPDGTATGGAASVRIDKTEGASTAVVYGDTYGVGFSNTGQPFRYQGTNVGGAGAVTFGARIPGTWTYLIHADTTWLSLSLTSPDGATIYRHRLSRATLGAVRGVVVTSNDTRAGAGIRIGPLSVRKADVSPAPPLSLAAREIGTQAGGQDARIVLPAGFDSRRPAPVIFSCHGNTQDQNHLTLSAQRAAFAKYFTDAGFIYAASFMHGNQWGAPAAVNDLVELYKYLRDRYPVGPLVILGESMGGLATMNAVHRGVLPIAGAGILDGVMNLGWQYENGVSGAGVRDADGINAAYGIAADGSDYAAKTAGYDPALAPPADYRGVPLRFVASPDDPRVPKSAHADVLFDRIHTVYPATTSMVPVTGGHTVDAHWYLSIWGDWFRSCVGTI